MATVTTTQRRQRTKVRTNGEGSIFQRASDGLWVATTSFDGKVYRFTAKEQGDATKKRKDWLRLRAQGVRPTSDRWPLNDWLDHWLGTLKTVRDPKTQQRVRGLEETTWARYDSLVRLYVKPYFQGVLLGDLTAEHIDTWQQNLQRKGAGIHAQHGALQRLSSALDLATARRHVPYNVAGPKQVTRPDLPKAKHVQPSEADLQRLLAAIRDDPFEALIVLALGAGLRRQEIAGLKWEDVDSSVLVVRRRVNYPGKGAGRLERDGLKNGDPERRVHIGGLVVEVLQRRWKHQIADRLRAGKSWRGEAYQADTPSGYIFTNPTDGSPIQVRFIDKAFARIRDAAGLDQRRLHALRRVFTTLLDRGGVSPRVAQELAGHRVPEMTSYYQHPMESQKREAAQVLDAQLRALRG